MTITDTPSHINALREARGLLADLAEQGQELLQPDRHMAILLAMDHLERAGLDIWGPPPPPTRIHCVDQVLDTVRRDLTCVLEDVSHYRVLSVPVGFAVYFVEQARRAKP